METSERALRERIVWRGEKFPVGVSDPPGLHLLVEEVGFLDMLVSRQSKKATEATDALIMTPCCQSVLAVMLAKAGVSVSFTYYWI